MKKTLIAGAGVAALAMAALPMAGVFATASTSTVTDSLSLTLNPTCSISRTSGVAGDSATTFSDGTYTTTIGAGVTKKIGTSTFSITCNDTHNGHKLDLGVTGLTGTNSEGTIDYSNKAVSTTVSGWNVTVSANTTLGITSGLVSVTNKAANLYGGSTTNKSAVTSQTFTAEYNVGTTSTQPAGTYTGSATYTLTYGA